MKYMFLSALLLNVFLGLYAADEAQTTALKNPVSSVDGAAYYVIHGREKAFPVGGICYAVDQKATLYTADGEPLKTVEHNEVDFLKLGTLLDPKAKPKAASYSVEWWDGIPIGFGMTKGMPGNWILFQDKHGNYIKSFRCEVENEKVFVHELTDDDERDKAWTYKEVAELKTIDASNAMQVEPIGCGIMSEEEHEQNGTLVSLKRAVMRTVGLQ